MFGPPHIADGVVVGGTVINGARVTEPGRVGDGPGDAVHVGGRDCWLTGSAGPSGCDAKV